MIPFNRATCGDKEKQYILKAINNNLYSGDGEFNEKCKLWFSENFKTKSLLVTSCTHALEMSAILAGIKPGDEVIMPSFTYVSTANAFVLMGAHIVFVDIRPDTLYIDETLIEAAITPRTRVIVPVHYGGNACEMDSINEIANKYHLRVIEDNAAGIMAEYKGRFLGTIGDLGCISFHETKNIQCGEGGALLINKEEFYERAEIIRFKGTNRKAFINGIVNKYTWIDLGSNYAMNEISAGFLYAQLENAHEITRSRRLKWQRYYENLKHLSMLELPYVSDFNKQNGHVFYIKAADYETRDKLILYLRENSILSVFHYIPLHSSPAGKKWSTFAGEDKYTTKESERLLRLPLYHNIADQDIDYICSKVRDFFAG